MHGQELGRVPPLAQCCVLEQNTYTATVLPAKSDNDVVF